MGVDCHYAIQIPRKILRQLIIAVMYTTEAAVKLKPAKIQASTGFEPMISAIPVQCSIN